MFSHTPGRVKGGDTGDIACDHYHRWIEDVEWLARGNFNAYRFSTAWPRILPAGTGAVEAARPGFLRSTGGRPDLRAALRRGSVSITGICRRRCRTKAAGPTATSPDKFADYARVVARRLGDRVKHCAMFNEPNMHALFGYGIGGHAPGLQRLAQHAGGDRITKISRRAARSGAARGA